MLLYWRVCYTTITPESAEYGDFEDSGMVEECEGDLSDLLSDVRRYGINPRSVNDCTSWFESEYNVQDYRTGEEIQYTLHLIGRSKRHFDRINKVIAH